MATTNDLLLDAATEAKKEIVWIMTFRREGERSMTEADNYVVITRDGDEDDGDPEEHRIPGYRMISRTQAILLDQNWTPTGAMFSQDHRGVQQAVMAQQATD